MGYSPEGCEESDMNEMTAHMHDVREEIAVVRQLQNENPAVDIHEAVAKVQLSSFPLLSRVRLFGTPWTAACQASVSIPIPGAYLNSCPSSW